MLLHSRMSRLLPGFAENIGCQKRLSTDPDILFKLKLLIFTETRQSRYLCIIPGSEFVLDAHFVSLIFFMPQPVSKQ